MMDWRRLLIPVDPIAALGSSTGQHISSKLLPHIILALRLFDANDTERAVDVLDLELNWVASTWR